ncbi:hypothetical protein QQS21_003810 [Conoideocrella luteorostrata]|uniref:Amidohydrolase-related domain-containing protein n=1 Tax=Conoideocrella luteorostrata TaxID=1105319 RepID=A0AAJ0CSI5_9HYPO|nr:hypothetical protein QQS21_003810 [Conoideocrella luteorostrata]
MLSSLASYNGPIFDVQAHAIEPSTFQFVYETVQPKGSPTNDETAKNVLDICQNLADDLSGSARRRALGAENTQVVTVNTFFPELPLDQLLNIVNNTNNWMARATEHKPNLIGTATIAPPPRLAKAGLASDGVAYTAKGVNIVRRAITELGFKAIMVASNYDDVFLGDASFDPYFSLAHELAVPIIIHPAVKPVGSSSMSKQNIGAYAGYLNDQRATLLAMVMSGTLDRYPNLTIIATHLGGGILTSLGRFEVLQDRFPRDTEYVSPRGNNLKLRHPIDYYLKNLYYDCNNAEVADIHHAMSTVGADRLLTGTDFPWTNDTFTRQILGKLDGHLAGKLAYSNAAKLFK